MTTYLGFLPQESDGNAKIKSEYVIIKHKPKNANQQLLSQPESKVDNQSGKPQKKVRGQNKNRPRPAREDVISKLCPSKINKSGVCVFGDKCKYMHDVDAFMKVKPEDLGPECVSFRKKGWCPYSYACRFGGDHLTHSEEKGYENVVNEELKSKNLFAVANVLSRELQICLRKRKVDFSRTEDALKNIEIQKRRKVADSKTEILQDQTKDNGNSNNEISCSEDLKTETKTNFTDEKNSNSESGDSKNAPANCDVLNANSTNSSIIGSVPITQIDEKTTALHEVEIESKLNLDDDTNADLNSKTQTAPKSIQNLTSEESKTVTVGSVTDEDIVPLRINEKKKLDFSNKLYLAPLTTCGNLPFRVVCKRLGADVTCGEMALSTSLLQGQTSEWALMKRHECEDIFGVQVCGAFPDTMGRCAELLDKHCEIDFIDINMGCPIDLVFKKGAGSALMRRTNKLFDIIATMNRVISVPLTCKLRTGVETSKNTAHNLMTMMRDNGVALATLHGRSREARYTRIADWQYIDRCARAASPMPVFGNGDIFSYHDYYSALENTSISGIMIARGALIKPWIFTEIKERRDWDISSSERFDVMKGFVNEGLMHWGSDSRGIEITRRFLLEWCSFLHRYIPLGILERIPQRINERPPYFVGRNDLETLMASPNANDWVKLSEMLLGPVPDSFTFLPKHKANSYK